MSTRETVTVDGFTIEPLPTTSTHRIAGIWHRWQVSNPLSPEDAAEVQERSERRTGPYADSRIVFVCTCQTNPDCRHRRAVAQIAPVIRAEDLQAVEVRA